MTIAILSDIHGNHEALEAVLEDIEGVGASAIYSLGDNVGYGGEPDRVIKTLSGLGIPSVVGNHELAVNHRDQLDWFNPQARRSLERTIEMLSPEAVEIIGAFPDWRVAEDVRMVHGFPPDSPIVYQFQVSEAERDEIMGAMEQAVCFIGHTHFPDILLWDGSGSRRVDFQRGVYRLDPHPRRSRYVINVGSVGQPRDGNNNAKYVVYRPDEASVELRFVPYDVESAVEKILAAGLPQANAWRLR